MPVVTSMEGIGMSEQSGGPGWWVASDGKWYAPEHAPAAVQPASGGGRSLKVIAGVVVVALLVGAGAILLTRGGGGGGGSPSATVEQLTGSAHGIAVDQAGDVLISDGEGRVQKVAADGRISTVAGTGVAGSSGDGGPAFQATLDGPTGLAIDHAGNLFISEGSRVRKVAPDGQITTVAGTGVAESSGDGGPAIEAGLNRPGALAVDQAGNLFIAERVGVVVRKVDASGRISTVAGTGRPFTKRSGDGGPATEADLASVDGVAVDEAGNLFIADEGGVVRKVGADGRIQRFAGTGVIGSSGDSGPALEATLRGSICVAVDQAGDVFICDDTGVREVTPDGIINIVAGIVSSPFGPAGAATRAQIIVHGVAVDRAGNLFIVDGDKQALIKVTPDGTFTVLTGHVSTDETVADSSSSNSSASGASTPADAVKTFFADVAARSCPEAFALLTVGFQRVVGDPTSMCTAIGVGGVATVGATTMTSATTATVDLTITSAGQSPQQSQIQCVLVGSGWEIASFR